MKKFKEAICIKEGIYEGVKFEIGDIYPIVGNNNGHQLIYSDSLDDSQILLLFAYTDNRLATPEKKYNSPQFCFLER